MRFVLILEIPEIEAISPRSQPAEGPTGEQAINQTVEDVLESHAPIVLSRLSLGLERTRSPWQSNLVWCRP